MFTVLVLGKLKK